MQYDQVRAFDGVRIVDWNSVRWLSTNRCDMPEQWIVAAVVDDELIISHGDCLVRIHKHGVRKILEYSIDALFDHIKRKSGYGNQERIKR